MPLDFDTTDELGTEATTIRLGETARLQLWKCRFSNRESSTGIGCDGGRGPPLKRSLITAIMRSARINIRIVSTAATTS